MDLEYLLAHSPVHKLHACSAGLHIVLVVLDGIGRTDSGIYGKSNMPNTVKLASEGAVLLPHSLTGRYRFGMQHSSTQLPGMTQF